MMWFWSDKNQCYETLLAAIDHTVGLSSSRQGDLPGTKFFFLAADCEHAVALEYVIYLILATVRVGTLLLARLETVCVTEEAVRLEDAVFFHFVL